MNESNRIGILLFLYSRNELSPEEDIELQNWRKLSPDNERLFDEMGDPDFVRNRMADFYKERDEIFTRLKSQFPDLGSYSAYDDDYLGSDPVTVSEYEGIRLNFPEKDIADSGLSKAEFWNGLLEESRFKGVTESDEVRKGEKPGKKVKKKKKPIVRALIFIGAIAACIIGILALSLLWYLIFGENDSSSGRFQASFQDTDNSKEFKHDFVRGYKTARAHIVFGENAKGEPMDIFEGNPKAPAGKIYTMITYTGNEEILKLPDGTVLWMYPNSYLYFPAHYDSDTIRLRMEGKIYFETTSAKHLIISMTPPLRGLSGQSGRGEILIDRSAATFDISAYTADTSFNVNLVSGSASVLIPGKHTDRPINLVPGVRFSYSEGQPPIQEASDTSEIFSLKNGEISLNNVGIREIMSTLEQWYNVKVEYMGEIPDKKYSLKVPLESKLTVIIDMLNKQGLHITKYGKVISVVK